MLTVGGFSSTNLSMSCDWEVESVAIYDLSTLIWGSVFHADDPPYQVPQPVFEVIGGRLAFPFLRFRVHCHSRSSRQSPSPLSGYSRESR